MLVRFDITSYMMASWMSHHGNVMVRGRSIEQTSEVALEWGRGDGNTRCEKNLVDATAMEP